MNPFKHGQMHSDPERAHGRRLAALRAAVVVAALLLLVVLVVGRPATAAPQATIVRCDPATVAGPLGSTVDVDIYVQDVVDLWAADVRIAFDETALRVVDADPSSPDSVEIQPLDTFLSPDFTVRLGVYEQNGQTIIWYASTQVNDPNNPKPAATGSGPLAKITFQALKAGQFTLPIVSQQLATTNGEIPATAQGCSVTFFDIDAGGVTFVPFTAAN